LASYETFIPRGFVLESGKVVRLSIAELEEKLAKETVFRL